MVAMEDGSLDEEYSRQKIATKKFERRNCSSTIFITPHSVSKAKVSS